MKDNKYSRRNFLHKYLKAGSILAGAGLVLSYTSLSAVTKELAQSDSTNQQPPKKEVQPVQKNPCDDLSGVSAEEIEKRKKLAYVTKTPIPDSHCSNCTLYLPPAKDKPCGGCLLFKGPVRPDGYCAYWAPINN
jgi:hypothetical protein|uniref:high-potential iron-sulfur protein n=1 Tax=Daejeonella sp. TaxID=2805397 RepID=UPI00404A91E5